MATKILFVCLGNICRSPAAEGVFRQKIKDRDLEKMFEVDSAGTGGWHVGDLPDSRMRKAALARGIHLESRSRKILDKDLYDFDFILVMDQDNFKVVNALVKDKSKFIQSKIELLLKYSKNSQLVEVPDPYYGGEKGFDKVLDLLDNAIDGLLESLIN